MPSWFYQGHRWPQGDRGQQGHRRPQGDRGQQGYHGYHEQQQGYREQRYHGPHNQQWDTGNRAETIKTLLMNLVNQF